MWNLSFEKLYDLSLKEPEKLWDSLASEVVWDKKYSAVINHRSSPLPKWFFEGKINMSFNCLDRHINDGRGDDLAVIFESPVTRTVQKITYQSLLESVEKLSGVLADRCNTKAGDRVLLYFPVIPQCLIAMLACSRIGVIYTVIYGGFPAEEVADRIRHIEPKIILTSNVGFDGYNTVDYKQIVDEAIEISQFDVEYCVVYNRGNYPMASMIDIRDLDWETEMMYAVPQRWIPMESDHPLFIIYSSGTTGEPKGFVMTTGAAIVTDKYTIKYLLNIKSKETFWMFSDFGWITGQTVMSYGPLLMGCTTILYEGKPATTPNPQEMARIINEHNVASFMASPTIFRILKNYESIPTFKITINYLRAIYIAGEKSDSNLIRWISDAFNCPVYDIWGQTELNGVVTSPALYFGKPVNSVPVPMFGIKPKLIYPNPEILGDAFGEILLTAGLSPVFAETLFKDDKRYIETYFTTYQGFYDTKDCGRMTEEGGLEILSRSDDIIKVNSMRFCGGAIEEICLKNHELVSAAVVGVDNEENGQVPFGFLVKRKDSNVNEKDIMNKTKELVKHHYNGLARLENLIFVADLPKTNTHKISRCSLSAMLNRKIFKIPPTVENRNVYQDIYETLRQAGIEASLPKE